MNKFFRIYPFLFIALNTFDALSTFFAVRAGLATELNPIMAGLLNHGWASFLFFKLVFVNGIILFARWRGVFTLPIPGVGRGVLYGLLGGYVLLVLSQIVQLLAWAVLGA